MSGRWSRVEIDGNDGTGKSTVIARLKALGYEANDRGLATRLTDDLTLLAEARMDTLYIVLDCPVEECRRRLALAGRDLKEKYHTVADLTHYRAVFLTVAKKLPHCHVIDAARPTEEVVQSILALL